MLPRNTSCYHGDHTIVVTPPILTSTNDLDLNKPCLFPTTQSQKRDDTLQYLTLEPVIRHLYVVSDLKTPASHSVLGYLSQMSCRVSLRQTSTRYMTQHDNRVAMFIFNISHPHKVGQDKSMDMLYLFPTIESQVLNYLSSCVKPPYSCNIRFH